MQGLKNDKRPAWCEHCGVVPTLVLGFHPYIIGHGKATETDRGKKCPTRHRTSGEGHSTQQAEERATNIESEKVNEDTTVHA